MGKNLDDFRKALEGDGDLVAPLKAQFGDNSHVVLHWMNVAMKGLAAHYKIRMNLMFVAGVVMTLLFGLAVRIFSSG